MAGGDKGGSKKSRAKGVVLDERLDFVEELLVRACSSKEIRQACAQKWRISPRQADEYSAKVKARWAVERAEDRPAKRACQVRRILRTIRRADEVREFRAMIAAEALLAKIEGTEFVPGDDDAADEQAEIVVIRGGQVVT